MRVVAHSIGVRLAVAGVLLAAHTAWAVEPTLSMVVPRGGQRGTEVEITLIGTKLTAVEELVFHEPGIEMVSIEPINDGSGKAVIRIAPDAALGTHGLRARTRQGISGLVLFSVGALSERTEAEPNSTSGEAESLALDSTVNGVVTSEDDDYFAVALDEGERLAVEVEAMRLASVMFDPKLRLFDPAGREIIAEDDTPLFGQDAGFVHTAATAGTYRIAVSEAAYGGNNGSHYRLHVGRFPRPLMATPLGGPPDTPIPVTWLGDASLATGEVVLASMPAGLPAPAIAQAEAGVSPTGIPFLVSPYEAVVEVEPNDTIEAATVGAVPGAFSGVVGGENDLDHFAFDGVHGQQLVARVWARELGSPLDSVLHLFNATGGVLTGNDDSVGLDSAIRFGIDGDGRYHLRVMDQLRRGGSTFAYRIEVTPVAPTLSIGFVENEQALVAVPAGNHNYVRIAMRRAEFDGPIPLTFSELPEGIEVLPVTVPQGQGQYPVILRAAAEAAPSASLARIDGRYESGETVVVGAIDHNVKLINGANNTTFFGRDVDRLAVAVTEPAPFSVAITARTAPIVHGGYALLEVVATRAEGFADAIALRFPWMPSGTSGGTASIPAEQDRAEIRMEATAGCPAGDHAVFVEASAAGYRICSAPQVVTIAPPWVQFQIASVETEQGTASQIEVALTQIAPFDGEALLNLGNLPKGVTTEPQPITAALESVVFPLTIAEDAAKGRHKNLVVSTSLLNGAEPVAHVAGGGEVAVYAPLPPDVAAQAAAPPPDQPEAEAEAARKTRFPSSAG